MRHYIRILLIHFCRSSFMARKKYSSELYWPVLSVQIHETLNKNLFSVFQQLWLNGEPVRNTTTEMVEIDPLASSVTEKDYIGGSFIYLRGVVGIRIIFDWWNDIERYIARQMAHCWNTMLLVWCIILPQHVECNKMEETFPGNLISFEIRSTEERFKNNRLIIIIQVRQSSNHM